MAVPDTRQTTAVIVGGGQAGLATAFHLRRAGVPFVILDDQPGPGGAWRHAWPSLRLFSTAEFSNLPGRPMSRYNGFPPATHVVDYLASYEERYGFPVERPVRVTGVTWSAGRYTVHGMTDSGPRTWTAPHVIAATGTWSAPFVPALPGTFGGRQWHTVTYPGPTAFRGSTVAVVGGANSGAQIAAELALAAADAGTGGAGRANPVAWYTRHPPRWMPDDVDGRVLFRRNRARALAVARGDEDPGADTTLGDIVMVPEVRRARDTGLLTATPMVNSLADIDADNLIWCTGFRPALGPFRGLLDHGSPRHPGLHLVGYGDLVGPGAATITGVGMYAKRVVAEIVADF
ncbi:MAG: NAD(P)-binding domain-containing protein [Corynebacterium variabile]|uniref:NAD(P)-binding domain-containing protein n=1 Tax=Corynebacterium variabile TaxID=1727 RepID=UPI003F8DC774